jgi:hypothetical protein
LRRDYFIELVSRKIHGGFASDDSQITNNLISTYVEPAIGVAAQKCYSDNLQIEGIGYVNSSFYITYKNLSISSDGNFIWKITLPDLPMGLGHIDGISRFVIKDNISPQTSYPVVLMNQGQVSIHKGMRPIPNKILGYPEGEYLYLISTLLLNQYTGQVTMISGGDATDLDSELNVPANYLPIMIDWICQKLMEERLTPQDRSNDGSDAVITT